MIEKMEASQGNVLGFKLSGHITKADYDILVPAVQAAVQQDGSVSLLLNMQDFKWEEASAWGDDLHFGRTYRKKVDTMAIVGDKRWEKWIAKLAAPFFAEEAQFFQPPDTDAAWEWLGAASS